MARLEFRVHGNLNTISLDAFVVVLRESLSILSDLDKAASGQRSGSLKWVISGLRQSSAVVEARSYVIRGDRDKDVGFQVAERYVSGLKTVFGEGITPSYFTLDTMNALRKMTRVMLRESIQGVTVVAPDAKQSADLSGEGQDTLEDLVGVHHKSVGSVEGRIELVSVHPLSRRFNLYHTRTNKAIRCNLPEALERDVFSALEHRRRAIVSGVISYNVRGEPLSIQVTRPLRLLGQSEELPKGKDILGTLPDLTGELTTEQHLRRLREG